MCIFKMGVQAGISGLPLLTPVPECFGLVW